MLYLTFSIINPFARQDFKNTFNQSGQLTKHKCWELESYYEPRRLLGFDINLEWRGSDHAGPGIELSLLGRTILFKIYDIRHWNSKENNWCDLTDYYNDNFYDYQ